MVQYEYTTQVVDTRGTGEDEYLLSGCLDGNFPGGTAERTWRFTLACDRVSRLRID